MSQIKEWFQEEARKDAPKLDTFCKAFPERDVAAIEEQLNHRRVHSPMLCIVTCFIRDKTVI